MTLTAMSLAFFALTSHAAAGDTRGHHIHDRAVPPAAEELCACGSASISRSACILENSAGSCVLRADSGGECRSWHCHPGEAEAHKAPWAPGKTVPLKPLPAAAPAPLPGADSCKPAFAETAFPHEIDGPSPSGFNGCVSWTGASRVDYPTLEGKADCSRPAPTLVTTCTATLDPKFRLTRTSDKGSDCRCGEWTAVARPLGGDGDGTSQTSTCTAYICRPKPKA